MKFSGLVVLKYLFQYPKNHFGQPSTFWAVDHSIWSKIAKNASISYTLEAIIQDLDFSRTCGFRREFRKGPSFQKIAFSGSLSCLIFRQNSIMCQKSHIFVLIGWSGFFLGNPAVLRHSGRCFLTSCQKSWNSLRGKYHNFFARGARIWVICSTEVENSVLYTPRDNSGHNSRTGHDFDLRFSR